MAGFALLLLHLMLVGWVTLRPLDVMWVNAANLTPFAGIKADLALGPVQGARRIGEGLLLLAPLGVLLPMVDGRLFVSGWASMARTVTAGAMISLGIELLQTGVPGRVVDVDALLLNTTGVALAHLVVVPAGRARLRRARRSRTVPRRVPRFSRVSRVLRGSHPGGREKESDTVARDEALQGTTPTIPRVGIAP
ncbi:putative integral membrane protein [Streptomyces sp. L-9-10]|uniref:VanZ family protein n=1 Tax=unclassified Streptomyces TaxID=2593676 RepID=UPI00101B999D|nr:VanZ family protein [Streptomyces sp. L-9-10]RYJ24831.1 putative integral membrane protein [Streptomyces sp. L-9-10]